MSLLFFNQQPQFIIKINICLFILCYLKGTATEMVQQSTNIHLIIEKVITLILKYNFEAKWFKGLEEELRQHFVLNF